MTNEDRFDALLREALQGDEQPSPDFTARVMAQVEKTPQRKPAPPRKKLWLSLAACAAVVVLALPVLRLSTLRMGSAADCAAPAEACETEEAVEFPAAEERSGAMDSSVNTTLAPENEALKDAAETDEALHEKCAPSRSAVTIDDDELCAALRQWLAEHDIASDDGTTFPLTAKQAQLMEQSSPEVSLPDYDCQLILNG